MRIGVGLWSWVMVMGHERWPISISVTECFVMFLLPLWRLKILIQYINARLSAVQLQCQVYLRIKKWTCMTWPVFHQWTVSYTQCICTMHTLTTAAQTRHRHRRGLSLATWSKRTHIYTCSRKINNCKRDMEKSSGTPRGVEKGGQGGIYPGNSHAEKLGVFGWHIILLQCNGY